MKHQIEKISHRPPSTSHHISSNALVTAHLHYVVNLFFVQCIFWILHTCHAAIMTVLLKNLFTVHILIWHTQIRSQHYLWWQNSAFMDTARISAISALLYRCCGEEQRWILFPFDAHECNSNRSHPTNPQLLIPLWGDDTVCETKLHTQQVYVNNVTLTKVIQFSCSSTSVSIFFKIVTF